MNEAKRQEFRQLIAARLAALDEEDSLGKGGQDVVTLDQQSVGRLSRMDALQSQAMAKATQARRDAERRRLHAALSRLDDDEFGYCEDCGDAIARGRLQIDLTATRCVDCASG